MALAKYFPFVYLRLSEFSIGMEVIDKKDRKQQLSDTDSILHDYVLDQSSNNFRGLLMTCSSHVVT